jgi:hypothetical protein
MAGQVLPLVVTRSADGGEQLASRITRETRDTAVTEERFPLKRPRWTSGHKKEALASLDGFFARAGGVQAPWQIPVVQQRHISS